MAPKNKDNTINLSKSLQDIDLEIEDDDIPDQNIVWACMQKTKSTKKSKQIDIMALVRQFEAEVWLKEPSLKNKIISGFEPNMVFNGIDTISISVKEGIATIKFQFEVSVLELCTPITPNAMGIMVRNCTDQDVHDFLSWAINHKEEILAKIEPDPNSKLV